MTSKRESRRSAADLYKQDYHAWTETQAAALRRLTHKPDPDLDLEHLATELESLGRRERDAVRHQARRIIEHLLKLEYSRAKGPRDGWRDALADARSAFDRSLSPSLRRDLVAGWAELYTEVLPTAQRALRTLDESASAAALPTACPYDLDDVCHEGWYPANRHGVALP